VNQQQARDAFTCGAGWRTSSYSQGENNCVEVSTAVAGWVGLRDSKNPDGGPLAVPATQWKALVATATS
jgi:hypothetical protein